MPLAAASAARWFAALRPGWYVRASSSAPTSRNGQRSSSYGVQWIRAVPASGRSRPVIMRMVVDFPDPFGPRKPVTAPGRTSKPRPSTATVGP